MITMPTPRRIQVDVDATRFYHCIGRCVRRAYLCGWDRTTGRSFDHRKEWLVARMGSLAEIFAIDICAYAVMSNHFHLVLRVDPERAAGWSDAEVQQRYAKLFPHAANDADALPASARAERCAIWRTRLYDLSWFMRCLNEYIARRANREDQCTGRFWEGRFRSQALLDPGAVLTCMSYVDLNPIRAGVATTLADSRLTSIQERIRNGPGRPTRPGLAPFLGDSQQRGDRAPESLPVRRDEYIALLEHTAAVVQGGRSTVVPPMADAALRRTGLAPPGFASSVREFARGFFGMVGEVQRIELESARRGYRRRLGLPAARRLYRCAESA